MTHERNYARFYTLLKLLPSADKESLVAQYTDGRTTSLRETTPQEYDLMCRDMERLTDYDAQREALRRQLRCRRSGQSLPPHQHRRIGGPCRETAHHRAQRGIESPSTAARTTHNSSPPATNHCGGCGGESNRKLNILFNIKIWKQQ